MPLLAQNFQGGAPWRVGSSFSLLQTVLFIFCRISAEFGIMILVEKYVLFHLKSDFTPKNKIIKVSQNEFKITATAEFQIFHLLTELIIKFCNLV